MLVGEAIVVAIVSLLVLCQVRRRCRCESETCRILGTPVHGCSKDAAGWTPRCCGAPFCCLYSPRVSLISWWFRKKL